MSYDWYVGMLQVIQDKQGPHRWGTGQEIQHEAYWFVLSCRSVHIIFRPLPHFLLIAHFNRVCPNHTIFSYSNILCMLLLSQKRVSDIYFWLLNMLAGTKDIPLHKGIVLYLCNTNNHVYMDWYWGLVGLKVQAP